MRKRVRQSLEPDRYRVVEATNGRSALQEIEQCTFDCIVTDLVMPDLDGFELLAEIQRRHVLTPVVVLTADIQKTTQERCEGLGATAFVRKPVPPETLRSVLAGILGGRY
jgi:two-component system chemotaxis response regulator CheY